MPVSRAVRPVADGPQHVAAVASRCQARRRVWWQCRAGVVVGSKGIGRLIGCLVAQCPKLGICSVGEAIRLFRLAKRFAFPGRLSSFAALPNEGATNRLRRLEWSAISDSARAFVLSVLSILQLTSACGALVFPEFCDLVPIGSLYDRRL